MKTGAGSIATFLLLVCGLASVFQIKKSDAEDIPCNSDVCSEQTCAKDFPDGDYPYPCCVSTSPNSNTGKFPCSCCNEQTLKICKTESLNDLPEEACKCKSKTPQLQEVINAICSNKTSPAPSTEKMNVQ